MAKTKLMKEALKIASKNSKLTVKEMVDYVWGATNEIK